MKEESEKTEKLVESLRRSRPVLANSDALSENIMRHIRKDRTTVSVPELIYELLFGWVYIGWMRRIMVAAAAAIILFFGYQQALILRRINSLSDKTYIETGTIKATLPGDLSGTISRYRFFGRKSVEGNINVSEKQIEKMIKSVNELQVRYKDIFELLEKDPELKKYVEERITKIEKSKLNN